MSAHRHMPIKPTSFIWNLFKDHMHFYFLLGIIPLGTLLFVVNVFIGPPQLADIPEGYEPKYWEYYNHPIKQWIAKTFGENPQETYEKAMHVLQTEHEKAEIRRVEQRVKALMEKRGDYQSWYFVPSDSKYAKFYEKNQEEASFYTRNI